MGIFEGASSTPQMRALLLAVRSLLLSGSIHGFSALPEMQTSFSGSNVISDLCAEHGCQPGACLGKPKDPRDGFTCKRPEALTCLKDQEACTAGSLNVDCSKCMGQCLSKEGCEKPVCAMCAPQAAVEFDEDKPEKKKKEEERETRG